MACGLQVSPEGFKLADGLRANGSVTLPIIQFNFAEVNISKIVERFR
jgi:hypothetical protein